MAMFNRYFSLPDGKWLKNTSWKVPTGNVNCDGLIYRVEIWDPTYTNQLYMGRNMGYGLYTTHYPSRTFSNGTPRHQGDFTMDFWGGSYWPISGTIVYLLFILPYYFV